MNGHTCPDCGSGFIYEGLCRCGKYYCSGPDWKLVRVNGPKLQHICPACGKKWECACTAEVIELHERECAGHFEDLPCSVKCGEQMNALMNFLRRYGVMR